MSGTAHAGLLSDLQRVVDGEVTQAPEVLERYSQDFGGIVQRTPAAVVRPRGAEDVARVVRYASTHGIPVSSRAMGHSLRGQALNEQGIVLDMRELRRVEDIAPDAEDFVAQPGALWREVVAASTSQGLAPPVLTGYPHASVGGTHSACGWGFSSARHGAQIDNCVELEVVTGTGEFVRCSRTQDAELFNHVLGGMGQFGLMTRIRHRLRRYSPTVRTYVLEYDDLQAYLKDNHTLASGEAVDYLECTLHQKPDGKGVRWTGILRVSVETGAPESLDDQRLLAGLRFDRHVSTEDQSTSAFLAQDWTPEKHRTPGEAHPWMVTFLPWSRLQQFLELCFRRVPPAALGGTHGQMRLWPAPRHVTHVPMLQVPREEMMALVGIFPTATQAGLPIIMALMSKLSDAAMEVGARRHLATWVHFDRTRWRMHFGDYWPTVNRLKRTYDPRGILNPGFIDFEPEALLSP